MKRRIVIFGLSGCGKSTMADMLGKKYKLRVVHPSGIMRDIIEGKNIKADKSRKNEGFWETKEGRAFLKNRSMQEKPIDFYVDKILVSELKKGNVVIDSWTLPWLSKDGVRIYLKATQKVRSERVSKRNNRKLEDVKKVIKTKDEETRQLFIRLYGFDIKKDHDVFDFVVDTNKIGIEQVFDRICKYLEKT